MKKKDSALDNQVPANEYTDKTATDNQWVGGVEPSDARLEADKTATDNQWVSTNKNTKK